MSRTPRMWLVVTALCVVGCDGKCGLTPATPEAASTTSVEGQTAPAADRALEPMLADLRSGKPEVRVAAADALAALGSKAAAAVPDLVRGLEDENFWAGLAMSDALSHVGQPAVPALVEALQHKQELARIRAGLALRSMGAVAKPALPALRQALQDQSPRVRELAAQAIEELESDRPQPANSGARRVSAAAVLPPADLAASADWAGFRGSRRDGLCLEKGLLKSWPESGPKLLWKWEGLGKGYSSVSIAAGRLFTMGDRTEKAETAQFVLAYDLAAGKPLWATHIGPPHKDGPRCTPTVDGDLLYALGTEGDLVCLETATGKERWHKKFAEDFGGQMMTMWKYCESPLVDGEKLICTPGGKQAAIVALDKKSGAVIWKSTLPELGPKGKDGAGYSSAVAAEIDGVRQYVQLMGRGAVGVAAQDGKFLWGYNRIANDVANVATPVVRGNQVFVTTSYKTGGALLKISAKNGAFSAEEVYFLDPAKFENHHGGVLLVGDYLYGGHGLNRGQPVCIHWPTGEIAWSPKPQGRGSAAVVYADGHLIFRYDRGDVFLIEAAPQEFRVKGYFKPLTGDGPAWAYPVVHGKRLYLRHSDLLACYDLSAE